MTKARASSKKGAQKSAPKSAPKSSPKSPKTSAARQPYQVAHPPMLRRDYSNQTKLGYKAATEARRSPQVLGVGGSGDFQLRYDRTTLIKASRAYHRDNGIFSGLLRAARDNILGSGFVVQPRTANKFLNDEIEKLWKQRSKRPEISGKFTWKKVVELIIDGLFVAGDHAAVKLASRDKSIDGKLQLIEAEQIDAGSTKATVKGNRIEGGIEVDKFGRLVTYYMKDYNPSGSNVRGRARKVPAESVIMPAYRMRVSQTRGVPPFVASYPNIERLDDILSSEAASWQLLSRLAVKRTQKDAAQMAAIQSKPDDNSTPSTEDLAQRVHDVGYAMIFNCELGEDIEGIAHDIPGANFTESVRMFLRVLGLPYGMPLELILLDWSETSYSSARASLEQAFVTFKRWQELLVDEFCTPDYEWQIRRWVRLGELPDRADITRHGWIVPQFPWLDQLKEAQAWGMKLDRGLATHAEALKSRNEDRNDFLEVRIREIDEAYTLAEELKKKHPELDVNTYGKHLCGLSTKATNISRKGTATPKSDGPDSKEKNAGLHEKPGWSDSADAPPIEGDE